MMLEQLHTLIRIYLMLPSYSYTRKNAQVVTNLFTICRQVFFALLVPSCCNKFKNSLIIHEENTKKNHKRVVSLYVDKDFPSFT
jgi:hypothetical protein